MVVMCLAKTESHAKRIRKRLIEASFHPFEERIGHHEIVLSVRVSDDQTKVAQQVLTKAGASEISQFREASDLPVDLKAESVFSHGTA